jgi:hypothetical protein
MTEDFLFIGCISYEERCNEAVKLVLGSTSNVVSAVALLEIDDDECTYPSWKEDCQRKTLKHRNEIEEFINENEVRAPSKPLKYAMSRRSQDIVRMKSDIEQTVLELFPSSPGVKCLVDITCMPSYFYFQLVKHLAEKNSLNEIIVLYTKPRDYPKNEPLKVSPFDRTKPDFLPAFGTPSGIEELLEKHKKVTWIVGVGFDYDSVKNAERIRDVMKIEKTNLIIPFPAYRPEYVVRTMKENQKLLKNDESFFYAPADNPFRTFQLIEELMGKGRDFVLSTFGPKPMGLGFCLAAIKNELPIIHVQATNYNPDFSSGSSDIFVFWLKHNGTVCYEYC